MIPNFAVVDDYVLRGGRPQGPEDYKWLAAQGVDTIFNFEGSNQEAAEMIEAGAGAFNFVHVPISPLQVVLTGIPWSLLTNTQNQINAHIGVRSKTMLVGWTVTRISEGKIFIHCRYGRDRTGLQVAARRMRTGFGYAPPLLSSAMQGEHAYQEALHYGYDARWNFGLNKSMSRIRRGEKP